MIDWPSYNHSLVRRGQVWILMSLIDGIIELSQMNLGKVGEPYDYPDSFLDPRLHESLFSSTI